MVKLLSATFGDEYGRTNVLKTLSDNVKDDAIDVYVDSSIIPVVDRVAGGETTRLNDDEKREIANAAAQMCGPSDQVCLEVKRQELAAAKLKEKDAVKTSSTAELIKGRWLEVTYEINGVKRTAKVPEGQQFQLGKLGTPPSPKAVEVKTPVGEQIASVVGTAVGTFALSFLYASSLVVTWMTFIEYGSRLLAAGMLAVAVFIPYSGFGLAFFGPFIARYFNVEKIQRTRGIQ